ncbi:hypothetical protein OSTOST_20666, partial [Ostertagia ostertagi]
MLCTASKDQGVGFLKARIKTTLMDQKGIGGVGHVLEFKSSAHSTLLTRLAAASPDHVFVMVDSASPRRNRNGGHESLTLESLVNFCYSGTIKISASNVLSVLPAACQLQLNEIQSICEFPKWTTSATRSTSQESDSPRSSAEAESFIRKWTLPETVNLEAIRTQLSDAGHLSIEAPKKLQSFTNIAANVQHDPNCLDLLQ